MIINETPEQPIGQYIRKRGILYYIERTNSNGIIERFGRYPSLIQAQQKVKELENTKWKTTKKKSKPVEKKNLQTCPICHKKFKSNYPNRKYCKNCRPKYSQKNKKQTPIKCKEKRKHLQSIDEQIKHYIKKQGTKYIIIYEDKYMGSYSYEHDAINRCHELINNNWKIT